MYIYPVLCKMLLKIWRRGWRPGLHLSHAPGLPDLSHLGSILLVLGVVVASPHHSRHTHHTPCEAVIAEVTASV